MHDQGWGFFDRGAAAGACGALLWLSACGTSGGSNEGLSTRADAPVVPSGELSCAANPYIVDCVGPRPDGESAPAADGAGVGIVAGDPSVDDVSGDSFDAPGTSSFVMVGHDPLSTFAVDVDTASYDVFRRDVEAGFLPDPASVRLEEYVNYFAYDYPIAEAEAEVPFTISLAAAPSARASELTLLRVGLSGKAPPAAGEKRPANLVFLVDVSGSMSESDKLPLAQQVLRQSLDLLDPTDKVAIVSYAGDTEVRLTPTAVAERGQITGAIDALVSSGGTNGASGIRLAYEQARAGFIEGGINHVVLCTDGDFNVGVSSTSALLELIREERGSGVTFTALGFGRGNLNDGMLEAISNAGNGFYGVISSEEQAAEYVDERLLSTLSLIARDMKVQVEFNPELVAAYRLLGYENRAIADDDFRDDVVDAGEIGAGHRVTALYELVLAGASVPSVQGAPEPTDGAAYAGAREVPASDLVQVKIRYKHVDATAADPALELAQSLAPSGVAAAPEAADLDLQWASAIATFSEVLKQSPYASAVDLDALGAVFEAQRARDDERAEFYELFLAARGML